MPKKPKSPIPIEEIDEKIHTIRGMRVMLDGDLAKIYGVATFRFNQAIKRNRDCLPPNFMFQLTREEFECLRSQFVRSKMANSSQFVMSSRKHPGRRHRPLGQAACSLHVGRAGVSPAVNRLLTGKAVGYFHK